MRRTKLLRAIVVLALSLTAIPLAAAADDDDARLSPCADFLQTADPDTPCTAQFRRILAQFAFDRSRDASGTTVRFPGAVIRYGASSSVEARIGLPSVVRRFGDDVENRTTDVLFGVKASAGAGRAVAGVAFDATLPTGNAGDGLPTFRARLAGSYALDKRTNIVGSVSAFRGAGEDDPAGSRRTVLAPALGVEFEPVDGTELELGITREITAGSSAHEVEFSIQQRIAPRVALRLGALRRTTLGASASTVSVGLNALL